MTSFCNCETCQKYGAPATVNKLNKQWQANFEECMEASKMHKNDNFVVIRVSVEEAKEMEIALRTRAFKHQSGGHKKEVNIIEGIRVKIAKLLVVDP